jgi:hypothetical protein
MDGQDAARLLEKTGVPVLMVDTGGEDDGPPILEVDYEAYIGYGEIKEFCRRYTNQGGG